MTNVRNDIFQVLKKVLKKKRSLHTPVFFNKELAEVKKCVNSSYVSTKGTYVQKFEKELKKIVKSKHVISTNSGTSAIEIALRSVNTLPNDEILVPALTFVATVNAITYCKAIPHFVDASLTNFGIDAEKLLKYLEKITYKKKGFFYNKRTKRRIFAILPVHVYGFPASMKKIMNISKKYNLKVVEDATEALGSKYFNKQVGTIGDIGTFSFNGNKIITTGGGGAIVTNNSYFYKRAAHLASTSKINHKWKYIHDEVGWNYRMPALNASLGIMQLKNFNKILKLKRKIAKNYSNLFYKKKIKFVYEEKNTKANYWLNTILLNNYNFKQRDTIINFCNKKGYNCRPAWNLICDIKVYKKFPKSNLDNSRNLLKNIINLPSGVDILKK